MRRISITLQTFILAATLFSCKESTPIQQTKPPVKVRVETVQKSALTYPITTIGKVSQAKEQKLAFKIGGIIDAVLVSEGQSVQFGDLLARLDMAEISANVKQAQQAYNKALRDFQRVENLYNDTVATLEQFQDVKTMLDVAQARLDIVKFNQSHAKIKAPADGIILKVLAEENEMTAPGYPVFLFGSREGNKILKLNITDKDIIRVNYGDTAHVSFDAYPKEKFTATVTEIGEFSDPYTGTYKVEVSLEGGIPKIPSGFIGRTTLFPKAKENMLTLPITALVNASEMHAYVWLVSEGKAKKHKINIKRIIEDKVVIDKSLQTGDTIVTEGQEKLGKLSDIEIIK